jgi:hypothetical protein
VCIKSYTKHLTKRKILKKDVGKDFESTKQLPAKIERNMSANKRRSGEGHGGGNGRYEASLKRRRRRMTQNVSLYFNC